MKAIIKTDLESPVSISIHDIEDDIVYRVREYLVCSSSSGGVTVIDTECDNETCFYTNMQEAGEDRDFDHVEPTTLSIKILVS